MKKDRDIYFRKDLLNHLRGFCMVVRNGCSITKASDLTGIEPGTLSKQIAAIEEDVGMKLFDRTNRKNLKLTKEGKIFYEDAVLKLQNIESLFDKYSANVIDVKRRNELRIAGLDAIFIKMMPFIIEYRKKNPNIKISLLNIPKLKAINGLINDEIDLAFYPCSSGEWIRNEIYKEKILTYNSYWVLYHGHPLAKKDEKDITRSEIAEYSFGSLSGSVYLQSFKLFAEEFKLKNALNIEFSSLELLKSLIKNKICISALDDFCIRPEEKEDFVLKNNISSLSECAHYLFYKKNCKLKDVAKEFLNIILFHKKEIFSNF